MAALGDFLRRAWIPLVTLVVVAGLTALGVQLRAGNRVDGGDASTQANTAGGQRQGGARQGGPGRSGNPENLPRDARTWTWWRDAEVKLELALSDEDVARIEQIYQGRVNRMRPFATEWLSEVDTLNQLVRARVAPYEEIDLQASKVESLAAELRKSRWVMAYRLYTELDPEQYQKLLEIRERRFNRGRGGSNR